MSVKDKFTPEEWKSLLKAPMLASYAVAGSAPSKRDDFIKEMAAVADGIVEGERSAPKDSLLGAVVAEIIANAEDEQRGQTGKLSLDEARAGALDTCRAAAAAVEAKASPEEAYEYKRWVLVVAEKVAAAAKEGGLFGFGGDQVSGAEVATINEIGEALKV
ncbi:MAG TPA: hypothetical protein VN256_11705 [Pyrinomonadaceae bacterium]|nr:hypothetical protein [Pyrinomonadaceae bacterium]